MRKKSSGIVWGIMMIAVGVMVGGKMLDWFVFDVFFRGWWTFFIIIPAAVKFFSERGERLAALRNLMIGLLLLLAAQGFVEWSMMFPLMISLWLVMTGLRMILPNGQKKKKSARPEPEPFDERKREARREERRRRQEKNWYDDRRYTDASHLQFEEEYEYGGDVEPEYEEEVEETVEEKTQDKGFEWNQYANREEYRRQRDTRSTQQGFRQTGYREPHAANRKGRCVCTSIFSGKEISYSHEPFYGAMLSAVFGGITLDLSDAVIYEDTVVEIRTVMGGIDVIVPKHVRVVLNSTPILGGVDNHVKRNAPLSESAPTLFINALCVLGGVDIK